MGRNKLIRPQRQQDQNNDQRNNRRNFNRVLNIKLDRSLCHREARKKRSETERSKRIKKRRDEERERILGVYNYAHVYMC